MTVYIHNIAYNYLAVPLVCALLLGCAGKRPQAAGTNRPGVLRVMAYNIHHCNPPSKPDVLDVDAIAAAIRKQKPDLVALQEVDVRTGRSGNTDQAKLLARKLSMHYFFAKAIDHDGGEYGLAILSNHPLTRTKIYRLPTQSGTNGEPRILATAAVKLPGGKMICFASTHLDAQKDSVNRELQIREINRIAGRETLPMIVAGDFNAAPGSGVIRQLDLIFTRTCQTCAPTIPVINPVRTIDFIAYKPAKAFEVITERVIPEHYASDHLPVVAELKMGF